MHGTLRKLSGRRNWVGRVGDGQVLLWLECPPEEPHPTRRSQVGSIWALYLSVAGGKLLGDEMTEGEKQRLRSKMTLGWSADPAT